jgi:hypothetical protein
MGSLFQKKYKRYRNLAGYAFSEDIQLGLSTSWQLRTPLKAFGASDDLVLMGGSMNWRSAFAGDGLWEVAGGSQARLYGDSLEFRDKVYLLRARVATPWLGVGRVVSRSDWLLYDDAVRAYAISLGGDNGLRGYPSQNFVAFGGRRVRSNIEFRSAPINIASLPTGVVAFYDSGFLYGGSAESGFRQSVGFGLRLIIPQASRFTYRLDFGVPTDGTGFMVTISGETSQAIPMTPIEDGLSTEAISVGGLVNQP